MTTEALLERGAMPSAWGLSRRLAWAAVAAFALLTWAAARVSVPMPFSPVPGTLQTVAVLLSGLLLGARGGAASQLTYLSLGLAGLPVFALPGAGPGYLLGPTGGYLIGFVGAAWLTGWVAHHTALRPGMARLFAALLAGSLTIHLGGLAWLLVLMAGDVAAAWPAAFVPFALFDLAKITLTAGLYLGAARLGREVTNRWSRATGH